MKQWAVVLALVGGCGKSDPAPPRRELHPAVTTAVSDAAVDAPDDHGHDRLVRVAREAGVELVFAGAGHEPSIGFCSKRPKVGQMDGSSCDRCELADAEDVPEDFSDGVAAAMTIIPRSLLTVAGLRQVAFCSGLRANRSEDANLGGTVDQEGRAMYIAFTPHSISTDGRRLFAHELYHLVDFARERERYQTDYEWNSLNAEGFHYGDTRYRHDGFARAYGQTNVTEDRATVFEAMVADTFRICSDYKHDAILQAKIRLVRRRLTDAIGSDSDIFDKTVWCLHLPAPP